MRNSSNLCIIFVVCGAVVGASGLRAGAQQRFDSPFLPADPRFNAMTYTIVGASSKDMTQAQAVQRANELIAGWGLKRLAGAVNSVVQYDAFHRRLRHIDFAGEYAFEFKSDTGELIAFTNLPIVQAKNL